jgi:hypothetical protein
MSYTANVRSLRKVEGTKWVRQYQVGGKPRWALMECKGGKAARVGTANTEAEYMRWWGWSDEEIAHHIAVCGETN